MTTFAFRKMSEDEHVFSGPASAEDDSAKETHPAPIALDRDRSVGPSTPLLLSAKPLPTSSLTPPAEVPEASTSFQPPTYTSLSGGHTLPDVNCARATKAQQLVESARAKALAEEQRNADIEAGYQDSHDGKPSSDSDSDDDFGGFNFRREADLHPHSGTRAGSSSMTSPPPSVVDSDDAGLPFSSARPRRSNAKTDKYRFRPALQKTRGATPMEVSFAEIAQIRKAEPRQKFSIESLLRDKRRREKQGMDPQSFHATEQQINSWSRMRDPTSAAAVVETTEVGQALKELDHAFVERANAGLDAALGSSDDLGETTGSEVDSVADLGGDWSSDEVSEQNVDRANGASSSAAATLDRVRLLDILEKSDTPRAKGDNDGLGAGREHMVDILASDCDIFLKQVRGPNVTREERGGPHSFWQRSAGLHSASPFTNSYSFETADGLRRQCSPRQLGSFFKNAFPTAVGKVETVGISSVVQFAIHGCCTVAAPAEAVVCKYIRTNSCEPEVLDTVAAALLRQLALLGFRSPCPAGAMNVTSPTSVEVLPSSVPWKVRVSRLMSCLQSLFDAMAKDQSVARTHAVTLASSLAFCTSDGRAVDMSSPWLPRAACATAIDTLNSSLPELEYRRFRRLLFQQVAHSPRVEQAGHDRWRHILTSLQHFPTHILKGRILQRQLAFDLLVGSDATADESPSEHSDSHVMSEGNSLVMPVVDLGMLLEALRSHEAAVNPLWVPDHPSAVSSADTFSGLEAKVQLLGMALSDTALQLCKPTVVDSNSSLRDPAVSDGQQSDGATHAETTLPAKNVTDIMADELRSNSHESVLTKIQGAMHVTQAFYAAVAPYTEDKEVARWLGAQPIEQGIDVVFTPLYSRLKLMHAVVDALHAIYGKVTDGRKSTTRTKTMARVQVADETNQAHQMNAREAEDPAWRSRAKDSIQRLALRLHYECEMYTGYSRERNYEIEESGYQAFPMAFLHSSKVKAPKDVPNDHLPERIKEQQSTRQPSDNSEAAAEIPKSIEVSTDQLSLLSKGLGTKIRSDDDVVPTPQKKRRVEIPQPRIQSSIRDFFKKT